jgi:hypothetical protein
MTVCMDLDSLLRSLPKERQRALRDMLDACLAGSSQDDAPPAVSTVFEVVSRVLGKRGIRLLPLSKFQSSKFYADVPERCVWLLEYIKAGFRTEQRLEISAALVIVLELLADRLETRNVPLSYNAMFQGLARIPWLVDRSFPGYWKSGLLGKLIKSRISESLS